MKIPTIALLAVVSMTAFSTSAEAGPGRGPGPLFGDGPGPGFPGPGVMLEHMADHLDLDDTQRENVRSILDAAKPEIDALREQARANREALEALDPGDPAYSTELNDLAVSNGRLASDGTLLFARIRTEVHAVLTEEQLGKLARSKERMRSAIERRASRD